MGCYGEGVAGDGCSELACDKGGSCWGVDAPPAVDVTAGGCGGVGVHGCVLLGDDFAGLVEGEADEGDFEVGGVVGADDSEH